MELVTAMMDTKNTDTASTINRDALTSYAINTLPASLVYNASFLYSNAMMGFANTARPKVQGRAMMEAIRRVDSMMLLAVTPGCLLLKADRRGMMLMENG